MHAHHLPNLLPVLVYVVSVGLAFLAGRRIRRFFRRR